LKTFKKPLKLVEKLHKQLREVREIFISAIAWRLATVPEQLITCN